MGNRPNAPAPPLSPRSVVQRSIALREIAPQLPGVLPPVVILNDGRIMDHPYYLRPATPPEKLADPAPYSVEERGSAVWHDTDWVQRMLHNYETGDSVALRHSVADARRAANINAASNADTDNADTVTPAPRPSRGYTGHRRRASNILSGGVTRSAK